MIELPEGGFACLPLETMAFSRGVAPLPGHALRRIRLLKPLPLEAGLHFAAEFIRNALRPIAAFCGCELRIPTRLAFPDFQRFNARYIAALQAAGFPTSPINPAARTNMAPLSDPPTGGVLHAFTFTIPSVNHGDYLISGMPELASPHVIAPRDTSPSGMHQKAAFVLNELLTTVDALGGQWERATAMQIYTRHPLDPVLDLLQSIPFQHIPGDPPLSSPDGTLFEFEADIRSISVEDTV
jgi:hypothetical protein